MKVKVNYKNGNIRFFECREIFLNAKSGELFVDGNEIVGGTTSCHSKIEELCGSIFTTILVDGEVIYDWAEDRYEESKSV